MPEKSAFREQAERQRRRIDALRAKLQAHITTRDREPAMQDRHLATILQSHRHDIRGVVEGSITILDLVQNLIEDYGKAGGAGPPGPTGPTGPQGEQGPPGADGECTCELTLEGDVIGSGIETITVTIPPRTIDAARLPATSTQTFWGRNTAGAGDVEQLAMATAKTMLNLAGTNTGDQTTVSGNAGTATALQTARTIGGISFDGSANIGVPFVLPFTSAGAAMTTGGSKLVIVGSVNTATAGQSLSKAVHFSRLCVAFNCGAQVGTPTVKFVLWKTNQTAGSELISVTSAAVATGTGQGPVASTTLLNGFAGALAAAGVFILTAELVGGTSATINSISAVIEGVFD